MGFGHNQATILKLKMDSERIGKIGGSLASIVFIVLTLTSGSTAVL